MAKKVIIEHRKSGCMSGCLTFIVAILVIGILVYVLSIAGCVLAGVGLWFLIRYIWRSLVKERPDSGFVKWGMGLAPITRKIIAGVASALVAICLIVTVNAGSSASNTSSTASNTTSTQTTQTQTTTPTTTTQQTQTEQTTDQTSSGASDATQTEQETTDAQTTSDSADAATTTQPSTASAKVDTMWTDLDVSVVSIDDSGVTLRFTSKEGSDWLAGDSFTNVSFADGTSYTPGYGDSALNLHWEIDEAGSGNWIQVMAGTPADLTITNSNYTSKDQYNGMKLTFDEDWFLNGTKNSDYKNCTATVSW